MLARNLRSLISISFIGRLLGSGLQYGIYIVIGRYLGAKSLGLFTFGFVILNIGATVSKIGLDKAVRKFIPIYRESSDDALLTGTLLISLVVPFCLGISFSLFFYFGSDIVETYFSRSLDATTMLFLVGIPFMALMTVGQVATTGFIQTKYSVLIKDIGQSLSAIVFVVIGTVVIGTVEATIVGYVFSLVVAAGLALYFLYDLGGFDGISDPVFEVRQILRYSTPLTIAALAQYLMQWTDVLMLGAFSTPAGIGRYQVAYQTAVILGFLIGAANSIFPSVASELYDKGQMDQLREMYTALTKWLTYLTALGLVFIVVNATNILALFGNEFTDIWVVLTLLGGAFTFATAVGPAGFLLMMTDHERVEITNTLVVAATNVALNYFLIQEFGVLGAALATGGSLVMVSVLRLVETWWFLDVRPHVRGYWKGAIAIITAFPLMLVGELFLSHSLVVVLVSGLLSLPVFCVVIYYIGFDSTDRRLIENLS
ncbi:oligosaccharide flippase family protein [Haloarcula sp. JP-L23]|uniref:oligosaccharide flippase family protein n=1 Tax=Haloarcula sp. JP-L23 TaxID=2716717 RepID=UPI00140EC67B|nr:oligosaccharide flippase family protein [Haloarcula sp. JP-L23]